MQNKTIIITGASSGIGEALATHFAQNGSNIVIAARSADKLAIFAEYLRKYGVKVLCVPTDVTKAEDCKQLIDKTIATFGGIDVLINNAGISMRALFEDLDLAVLEQVMQVNFWGTVYCTRYAIEHLLASKGTVVGVSSIAGYRGLPARTGYSASKFAMQGFLEALRPEVMDRGVNVMIACPGFTASNIRKVALTADGTSQGETPRTEDKMMTSAECAAHIYQAVVKRKRSLVLTTQGKLTVFLNKWFPGFMDKMVLNVMKKEADSPFK